MSGRWAACLSVLALAACAGVTPLPADGPEGGSRVPLVSTSDARLTAGVRHITNFPSELAPKLWRGMKLDPAVRASALAMAHEMVRRLDLPELPVADVVVMGSIASYEYDDEADFDVHIFLDPRGYAGDLTMLRRYVHQFNQVSRRRLAGVSYRGYNAEFLAYIDRPESQIGESVMYSLVSDRWLRAPTRQPDRHDPDRLLDDVRRYAERYNTLASAFNAHPVGFDCARFDALVAELRRYRSAGIQADGIRSTPNLVYRLLRRLDVNVPDALRDASAACVVVNASVN